MARILVTGGAGFIGSHVVAAYQAAGHAVAVVDDLSTGRRDFVPEGVRLFEADVRGQGLAEAFAAFEPEVVNHHAAQIDVRKSVEDPRHDAEVNILGSIALLEQCRTHAVERVIFASTGGAIYGEPAAEDLPATEALWPAPLSHYGTSKLAVEHYIALYRALYGLPYVILRYPNVYGPRQNPHGEAGVCSILTGLMLAGKTPVLYGEGAAERDYVFVKDIARANVLALEKGTDSILNLGSAEGVPVRRLFDILKGLLDFPGEAALKPLRPGEVGRIRISNDRAAAALDWRPEVGLDEGLRQTVAFIEAEGDAAGGGRVGGTLGSG